MVIGRDKGCQLRIPKPEVSRQHCEVIAAGGRIAVRDLESSNGVFVNGERVAESQLAAGDVLSIGPYPFVVRVDGKPEEIDAQGALEKAGAAAAAAGASPAGGGSSTPDESDSFDLKPLSSDESSVADFDFDFDDEEDEDQPAL